LPLVDLVALAAAVGLTGAFSPATAGYALGVLALSRQRRPSICLRVSTQLGRIVMAAALPLVVVHPWLSDERAWRLALCSALLLVALRSAAYGALRGARRRGLLIEPTLVVGAGEMGVLIADLLGQHPELGLKPLGFLDSVPPPYDLPLPVLGSTAQLPALIGDLGVRRVIVCFPVDRDRDMVPVLRACQPLRVDVCLVPRLQELGTTVPRAHLDEICGIPLIALRSRVRSPAKMAAKRALDVVGAIVLLCVFSPLLLAFAVLMRLQSGRSAIFRQVRVTGDRRTASILKLRTLEDHGDSDTCWSMPEEAPTALGRWLRASHADELPQLVNVLRGDMSLVGPRPERPHFVERFSQEIPRYEDRNRMPAGITGWAQVHGLNGDTSIGDRVRFDNQYIENWSPWLDVIIVARTFAATMSAALGGRR
jgi:exopolysaccharide biosynthesis polyprenyl glycosylphosphotransferase